MLPALLMNERDDVNKTFTDIDAEALDSLMQRVAEAKEYNLALSAEDNQLLLDALMTLAHLQERLANNDITLHKLRKLLGIVKSSEKLSHILPQSADNNGDSPVQAVKEERKARSRVDKQRAKRQRSLNRKPKVSPKIESHALVDLKKGDPCPACDKGKLYKYEPAQLVRITGHSPYTPVLHLSERLRCNACGDFFTALLPDAVKIDGDEQQKYGYSARTLMALNKYFAGSPFYRQESLQELLGVSITASTVYDQCEYVANALFPIFICLLKMAASASHYHLDDTTNRIINQVPIEKKKRNSDKTHLRSGIYTSGVIATLDSGHDIVLFKTNIGHAGEFIDEILTERLPNKPPPTLMSDALSSNTPTVVSEVTRSLCNAHGRRQFVDVLHHFPKEVDFVLKNYKIIWENEDKIAEKKLSATERLNYHREHSLPIMNAIRRWGNDLLSGEIVEENSGLGKAIRYFEKHYNGLTAFCTYEGAKLDNNVMEAQLKLVVRGRKNSHFYKTLAGSSVADVIMSMIATAAKAGINVFDYFNAIQRNSKQVKSQPESWLPWNFTG